MNLTSFSMFLILLFSVVSNYAAAASPPSPPKYTFSFYKLVLQWPGALCNAKGGGCGASFVPKDFTIHGLWPQYSDNTGVPPYDENTNPCLGTDKPYGGSIKGDVNAIGRDMHTYWPNVAFDDDDMIFWKHEWNDHGKCSAYATKPRDYFLTTLSLFKSNAKLLPILKKMGIEPEPKRSGGTTITTPSKVRFIIHKQLNVYTEIGCSLNKQGKKQLWEIRFCYSSEEKLLNCTEAVSADGLCKKNTAIAFTLP